MREAERLAHFAEIVRESSLKRFNRIAIEDIEWRPREDMLSFVDILQHLVDSDRWLLGQLQQGLSVSKAVIQSGDAKGRNWGYATSHDAIHWKRPKLNTRICLVGW